MDYVIFGLLYKKYRYITNDTDIDKIMLIIFRLFL